MTPKIIIRSFSTDQYFLDKCLYSNCYKLKPCSNLVAVDIGAHCGYFSFAAFGVGFAKIYAIEPFTENFKILIQNLEQINPEIFKSYNLAIYPETCFLKFNYPTPIKGTHFDFGDIDIEGNNNKDFFICPAITLDEFIENVVSEATIDLLKINIGYAEHNILMSSKLLKVRNICGEVQSDINMNEFKNEMGKKGFVDSVFETPEKDDEPKIRFFFSRDGCGKLFQI